MTQGWVGKRDPWNGQRVSAQWRGAHCHHYRYNQKHSPQSLCFNSAQLSQPPCSGWTDVSTQRLLRAPSPTVWVQSRSRTWGRARRHQSPRAELEICPAPICVPLTAAASGEAPALPWFSSHRGVPSPSQVARDKQQLWQGPWFQGLFNLGFYSVVRTVRHARRICRPAFIARVRIQRANTTRRCFGLSSTLWVAQGTQKSLP